MERSEITTEQAIAAANEKNASARNQEEAEAYCAGYKAAQPELAALRKELKQAEHQIDELQNKANEDFNKLTEAKRRIKSIAGILKIADKSNESYRVESHDLQQQNQSYREALEPLLKVSEDMANQLFYRAGGMWSKHYVPHLAVDEIAAAKAVLSSGEKKPETPDASKLDE